MAPSIRIAGFQFEGPYQLKFPNPRLGKGIYAIHRAVGNDYYRVYVGATTTSFNERITNSHDSYKCWKEQLQTGGILTISYLTMNGLSDKVIFEREANIIRETKPPCNETV